MVKKFVFEGNEVQQGHKCLLFQGPSCPGVVIPAMAIVPIDDVITNADKEAKFNVEIPSYYGLCLMDNNDIIYARSNERSAARSVISFDISGAEMPIVEDYITECMSSMSIDTDEFHVESGALSLKLHDGFISVAGTGRYEKGVIKATVDFTYKFYIKPDHSPFWDLKSNDGLFIIETKDLEVDGNNIIQDFILLFLKGSFKEKIEKSVEEELTKTIKPFLKTLFGEDHQFTIYTIDVETDKITFNVNKWPEGTIVSVSKDPDGKPEKELQPPQKATDIPGKYPLKPKINKK